MAGSDISYVQNLKRSVREAALSMQTCNVESSRDSHSDDSSEHFFVPFSGTGLSRPSPENKAVSVRNKHLFVSQADSSLVENHASEDLIGRRFGELPNMLDDLDSLHDFDRVNGFLSVSSPIYAGSGVQRPFYDIEETQDIFSPPLLIDSSLLADSYEDLLGMLVLAKTIVMF